jgi:hypothetical protein
MLSQSSFHSGEGACARFYRGPGPWAPDFATILLLIFPNQKTTYAFYTQFPSNNPMKSILLLFGMLKQENQAARGWGQFPRPHRWNHDSPPLSRSSQTFCHCRPLSLYPWFQLPVVNCDPKIEHGKFQKETIHMFLITFIIIYHYDYSILLLFIVKVLLCLFYKLPFIVGLYL